MGRVTRFLFVIGALLLAAPPLRADSLVDHTLVVYNSLQPESDSLARYYAEKRGIPKERILGIRCSGSEEIDRTEYHKNIELPIRDYLLQKKWMSLHSGVSPFGNQTLPIEAATHNEIWCIVLIKGIPLKIANDPTIKEVPTANPQLNTNAASVDSELALLPLVGLPLIATMPNPYQLLGYERSFDSLDARQMILVGRLDGPNADDVRRMIDDALYAEKHRLTGVAYIDARGLGDTNSGYYQGDKQLVDSAKELIKAGWLVTLDHKPALFPENMAWRNVGIYAGWYQENAAGPFMRPGLQGSVFMRGAIGYHIHSFSAFTLRSAEKNWCGPLIDKGVAATMGAVYEPYLDFMPHWDVFLHRLLQGSTFIEAAYASQKVLSWMTTFVGDPLYTPFAVPLDQAIADAEPQSVWSDELRIQQAAADLAANRLDAARADLARLADDPHITYAGWEGWADVMSDPRLLPSNSSVAESYERAFNMSPTLDDEMRIVLKAVTAYENRFREKDARRLLSMMLARYPNESVYFGLQKTLQEINTNGGIPNPELDSGIPPIAPPPPIPLTGLGKSQ